ncbi:MAG: NAD(P)H-binding protein [Pseudomonadota bacterium]
MTAMTDKPTQMRVLLFGASGTIGQATLRALREAGHHVTCFLRAGSAFAPPDGVAVHYGDAAAPDAAFAGATLDAVVSCMASRSGMPKDAWAVDHDAHVAVLTAAKAAGVTRFVLLSALCVQQPKLPFQHAKLAFEAKLKDSGLAYSIVRPTAFFKSLSGQVARVQQGKPFLLFGDGKLTACKPISDDDLGRFITGCLTMPERENKVLPIGGPGPAITPLDQGHALFTTLGRPPRFRRVPVGVMDVIIAVLSVAGIVSTKARGKADLARIGRYYATHSMLVWDGSESRYSADATPESGSDRLFDHYGALIRGEASVDLGDHAVF